MHRFDYFRTVWLIYFSDSSIVRVDWETKHKNSFKTNLLFIQKYEHSLKTFDILKQRICLELYIILHYSFVLMFHSYAF